MCIQWKPEDYGVKSREFRSSKTCGGGGEDDRSSTGKVVIPGEVTWCLQISLFCFHGLILHISIKISEHCQTTTLPLLHRLFVLVFIPWAAVLIWSIPVSQLFTSTMPPLSIFFPIWEFVFKSPSSIQLPVIFLILAHLAWIKDFKDPVDTQSNSFISPRHLLNGRKEMSLKKSNMKNVMLLFLFLQGIVWISRPAPRNCIQIPACSWYNVERPSWISLTI